MSCEQCRQWWSPYLDSELDAGNTFEVSEHLRNCAACRDRFEREAFIDDWLRAKLRSTTMPEDLWSSLCHNVRSEAETPQSSSTPQSPSRLAPVTRRAPAIRRSLAMAASIVILMFAGVYYATTQRWAAPAADQSVATPTPVVAAKSSITELLQEAEPRLAAFRQQPAEDFHERLDAICRRTLGVSVSIDPSETGGHPIELIDVFARVDSNGNPYVEVRLNCCGHPMLLAFAKADMENAIAELCCPTANCETTCVTGCQKEIPAEVQSIARGELMIAAVAVNHQVTSVLNAIHVDEF
jgi:hypothetical protein